MVCLPVSALKGAKLSWIIAFIRGEASFGIKELVGDVVVLWADEARTREFIPNYSHSIKLAWPLIHEARVYLIPEEDKSDGWTVYVRNKDEREPIYQEQTQSPMEACLRCFVARKLGLDVELPDELFIK